MPQLEGLRVLDEQKDMSKRKLDPTFAASEKMTLIKLMENYFNIIESNRTDAINMKAKLDVWHRIADEFNAISNIYPKDWVVLKNCWENIKKRTKQEQTLQNTNRLKIDEITPKKLDIDPATERVLEILRSKMSEQTNSCELDGTHFLALRTSNHFKQRKI